MRKNKESEITLSETKATSTQTPIEIALKIDENGMTTASQLYSFLELNPSNFSKWCNQSTGYSSTCKKMLFRPSYYCKSYS